MHIYIYVYNNIKTYKNRNILLLLVRETAKKNYLVVGPLRGGRGGKCLATK